MNRTTLSWGVRILGLSMLLVFAVGLVFAANAQQAQAWGSYLTQAETKYPTIVGTVLDSCDLCHTSTFSQNPYAKAFSANQHSFAAIENLDSDGDGYTNIVEISARTFPGDPNSRPAPVPTATRTQAPPTATNTRIPATATATNTRIPPTATATNTRVPATATATNTRVPATATAANTPVQPTATATRIAPTATSTSAVPTATRAVGPATATSTRPAPTATKVPSDPRHVTFQDVIRKLPKSRNWIGDWLVGKTVVHVTAQTKIHGGEEGDDAAEEKGKSAQVRVGAPARVKGILLPDGSVNATSIHVIDEKNKDWISSGIDAVKNLLAWFKFH
ncbi:MAG: hypothetical protein HY782_15415 [Chloroflexi bacterium]|nr:hypothetical protein [Chloroflexota bacterium]